jgi:uncharacterized membrane protein
MTKRFYGPYVLLALALVGIAVAFYDAYQLYNGQTLWCPPPINGCNEVANSPYARIYNLPVGYFGVVYYLYMFGLAALLAFDPLSRGLRFAALAYSALGVCFSIYFMYLQIGFIHAFCIYCLISAVTTLLLFIAALCHFRVTLAPTRWSNKDAICCGAWVRYWHLASFAALQHFGSYWGKADMPNGFSEGATVKSLKA